MSLPDALAGLPRPAGYPDPLYERSKDFANAANQLDDIADEFARLLLQVPGPWAGTSQSEFTQVMSGRPANYRSIAAGYRKAGVALKEYASALEHAQQTWDASRRLAEADWHRQIPGAGLPPDPFSPDRVRARSQVEAALERLRGTTKRTFGVLSALEATLGPRRGASPEIARGRRAAVMQGLDEIGGKARADWDTLWGQHRLFLPSTAKQAWKDKIKAWADDEYRRCSDPAGYAGDEFYEFANADEFQAGNDARAWAGLAYNYAGGWFKLFKKLAIPEAKKPDDEKKDDEKKEEKKSSCSPVG